MGMRAVKAGRVLLYVQEQGGKTCWPTRAGSCLLQSTPSTTAGSPAAWRNISGMSQLCHNCAMQLLAAAYQGSKVLMLVV
jgi:hypothetical protein